MIYGVEYYPNGNEGEQWEEVTQTEFIDLIKMHAFRGCLVETVWEGDTLTIKDSWGTYYA
jgi:hypothetical protein